MNINMNEVAKHLIENNKEPITSLEELTDEEVLKQLLQKNNYWLLREFSTGFLLDLYNHLFHLLTVDCLIEIKKSIGSIENVFNHTKSKTYCYELSWDYEREKENHALIERETDKVELETPPKHNLLIKINNSFSLKGYHPYLLEIFGDDEQFNTIELLVKTIYSIFAAEREIAGEMPRIELLVGSLIKRMEEWDLQLTHWSEMKNFNYIIDVCIDDFDFFANISCPCWFAEFPEFRGVK